MTTVSTGHEIAHQDVESAAFAGPCGASQQAMLAHEQDTAGRGVFEWPEIDGLINRRH